MNSNILATTSAVGSMLSAFRAHIRGRVLPAPVSLTFSANGREIAVQPEGGADLVQQLGNVLLWAYTLSDVTATWWRTDEDRLHVSVHGRTASGARMQVYGGGAFSDCRGLVPLALDESEGVSSTSCTRCISLLREMGSTSGRWPRWTDPRPARSGCANLSPRTSSRRPPSSTACASGRSRWRSATSTPANSATSPVPCGSTVESQCGPCARKARALRMVQCREGWHLTEEPDFTPDRADRGPHGAAGAAG